MIDGALATLKAIPWTWIGIAGALGLAAAGLFYVGQIRFAILAGVAAAACVWIGDLVGTRDFARLEAKQAIARADKADAATKTANANTARAEGEREAWRTAAGKCSDAVLEARGAQERREASAAAKLAAATVESAGWRRAYVELHGAAQAPPRTCREGVRAAGKVLEAMR